MATMTSNIEEVARDLRYMAHALDFNRRVRGGQMLGELISGEIAMGIFRRSVDGQVDPSGKPYAPLNAKYYRWKLAHGYSPKKNVQKMRMLSLAELKGQVAVTDNSVTMTYGRSEETRQLAEWAHEGSANRPARRFYDIEVDGEQQRHLDDIIRVAADDVAAELFGGI